MLNNEEILKYRNTGDIIIEPFNLKNLKTTSYDIRLGKYYFREQKPVGIIQKEKLIYNMYDSDDVKKVWGNYKEAKSYLHYKSKGYIMKNIKETDLIIMIKPGETILAHSEEFIGGLHHISSILHARSSVGRSFLKICACAGFGDVGYINKWTLEITNSSQNYAIPLVVGRRIGQISFHIVKKIKEETSYGVSDKYQSGNNIAELNTKWHPDQMLPKKYLDYEIFE